MVRRDGRRGVMGPEAAWILGRGRHREDANPSAIAAWDAWGDVRPDGALVAALRAPAAAGAGKWVGRGQDGQGLGARVRRVRLVRRALPA